jgi:hypothetical protein
MSDPLPASAPDPLAGLVRLAAGDGSTLVLLAVGAHRTYARVVAAFAVGGRVIVAVGGRDVVFDALTGRLVSPRGFRPPYRLVAAPPATEVDGRAYLEGDLAEVRRMLVELPEDDVLGRGSMAARAEQIEAELAALGGEG